MDLNNSNRVSMFDRRESIPMSANGSASINSPNSILNNGSNGTLVNTNQNQNQNTLRRASTITSTTNKGRRASMFDPIDPTELQKTLYQNQVCRVYISLFYSSFNSDRC